MITSRAPVIHALKLDMIVNPPCIWYKIPFMVPVFGEPMDKKPPILSHQKLVEIREIVMGQCKQTFF
jgi:hypothetical protein